jgi:hypothetical protein
MKSLWWFFPKILLLLLMLLGHAGKQMLTKNRDWVRQKMLVKVARFL